MNLVVEKTNKQTNKQTDKTKQNKNKNKQANKQRNKNAIVNRHPAFFLPLWWILTVYFLEKRWIDVESWPNTFDENVRWTLEGEHGEPYTKYHCIIIAEGWKSDCAYHIVIHYNNPHQREIINDKLIFFSKLVKQ